jgi:hypothetical protein
MLGTEHLLNPNDCLKRKSLILTSRNTTRAFFHANFLSYRAFKNSLCSRKKQTFYFYFMSAHTISLSKWCWLFIYNKCWKWAPLVSEHFWTLLSMELIFLCRLITTVQGLFDHPVYEICQKTGYTGRWPERTRCNSNVRHGGGINMRVDLSERECENVDLNKLTITGINGGLFWTWQRTLLIPKCREFLDRPTLHAVIDVFSTIVKYFKLSPNAFVGVANNLFKLQVIVGASSKLWLDALSSWPIGMVYNEIWNET